MVSTDYQEDIKEIDNQNEERGDDVSYYKKNYNKPNDVDSYQLKLLQQFLIALMKWKTNNFVSDSAMESLLHVIKFLFRTYNNIVIILPLPLSVVGEMLCRVAIVSVSSDIPATRKCCGFLGHMAFYS